MTPDRPTDPMPEAADLRSFMRNVPQAVSVVTAAGPDGPRGITVSAFFSVEVEPPLVLISIGRTAQAHAAIAGGRFRLHLLAEDQEPISRRFATPGLGTREQFPDLDPSMAEPPPVAGCIGWANCRVVSAHDEAGHTLFIGRVDACRVERPDARPLVYHQAGYSRLLPPE